MVTAPGWYIIGFHDVSWEANPYLSGLGLTATPDDFARLVSILSRSTKLIDVAAGFERWKSGALDKAYVSFWFDDAYAGVRRYAAPTLAQAGIGAALSVNSRFVDRTEMFWRAKLSYLSQCDGLRFLRSRLRAHGFQSGQPLRHATMDLFTPAIVEEIDAVYRRFTNEDDRRDAFRIFDTWTGVRALRERGWTIANHGAAHYPVMESSALTLMAEEFGECESAFEREMGSPSEFWVAPFDRGAKRDPAYVTTFESCAGGRSLVLVGNKANKMYEQGKPIFRIGPPADPAGILDVLANITID